MFVATAYEPSVTAIRYVGKPGPSVAWPRRSASYRTTKGNLVTFAGVVRRAAVTGFGARAAAASAA